MKKIYRIVLIFCCGFCALGVQCYAQNVTNITAKQVGNNIHVSYDLDKAADISLHLSTDSGRTFKELNEVSGDVGRMIAPGHKTIVWDVLKEVEIFSEDNVVFKVVVDASAEKQWQAIQRKEKRMAIPMRTFFTANVAYSPMPQWSYGFKVGQVKIVGWYLSALSTFDFNGMYRPFEEGQMYSLTGFDHSIRLSCQVGLVIRTCNPLSLMFGVGYGYRAISYNTTNNECYSLPKLTVQGVDAAFGLLFDIKKVAFSAEVVSTNFKTIEARVGIGFILPHNNSKCEE